MDVAEIDAVLFDVVGTLVDEDGTFASTADRLAAEAGLSSASALLERWVETLDRRMHAVSVGEAAWQPHRQLVSEAAREAVIGLAGQWSEAASALVSSLDWTYPAWPEVAAAIGELRRHRLVAALSNGDLDALARLANANAISWDIALSTGAVGTFKPAPAAYRYAIDVLRIDPARTLFVAAHPWDLRAASEYGFRTAYVARPGAERPADDDRFDLVAEDLSDVVGLLGDRGRRPGS
jgi:2-haloacid dehalogenase